MTNQTGETNYSYTRHHDHRMYMFKKKKSLTNKLTTR